MRSRSMHLLWCSACGLALALGCGAQGGSTGQGSQAAPSATDDPVGYGARLIDGRDTVPPSQQGRQIRDAWDAFRKAHEDAGGTWDFNIDLLSQPGILSMAPREPAAETVPGTWGSTSALVAAARACMRLYRFGDAVQLVEAAQRIDADDPFVRLTALRLESLAYQDWDDVLPRLQELSKELVLAEDPHVWRAIALVQLQRNKYDEALSAIRTALEIRPDWIQARINQATILAFAGHLDEAVGAVEQLRKDAPYEIYATSNVASRLSVAKRYDDVIKLLKPAIDRNPGLPAAWINLGGAYLESGRPREAMDVYRRLTQLMPQQATSHGLLARAACNAGEYETAEQESRTALKLPGSGYGDYLSLGEALLGQGEPDEAADAFIDALKASRGDREASYHVGRLLRGAEHAKRLHHIMTETMKRYDNADVRSNRATASLELDDYDSAIDDVRRAIQMTPDAQSYSFLAVLLLLDERPLDEVAAALRSALGLVEGHAICSIYLWIVERDLGNAAAAKDAIDSAAAACAPDNWYCKLVLYYAGKLTRDQLLSAAQNADQRCEAYFYIAEHMRGQGDAGGAKAWYRKCLDEKVPNFWESHLARLRLSGD